MGACKLGHTRIFLNVILLFAVVSCNMFFPVFRNVGTKLQFRYIYTYTLRKTV